MRDQSPPKIHYGQPRPCSACSMTIIMAYNVDQAQWEPIEMEGGLNHFLTCSGAKYFGNPGKHPANLCFRHQVFYRGARCLTCYNDDHPPLDSWSLQEEE